MANTTLKLNGGRQYVMSAEQAITFANVNDTAVAIKAINLPYGATIISGRVIVDEVFNVATSAVLDVGDLVSANRYANDVNLKALGVTALVPTNYISDGEAIWVLPVNVGAAATTGKARIQVEYIIKDRAAENQPN